MTDRELLELAAKAANIPSDGLGTCYDYERECNWNPITDDGDRYRLAIKLRLFSTNRQTLDIWISAYVLEGIEHDEAVSRSIVRAAAEIGKGMA